MSNKVTTKTMKHYGKRELKPKLRFPEFRDAEGWAETQIGALAISESSTLALNRLSFQPKGYPVYGADGNVGFISTFAQGEDYIAIIKDGSGVGRLSLLRGKSSVLGTLAYLKPKDDSTAILSWLFYYLSSLTFEKYVKGSGIPHIYFSDFASEPVGNPSIPEQQIIAECLTSLDELIAAHGQKLDALKAHKKGLMQQLFPCEGETLPRLRFPEFRDAAEWDVKPLEQLATYENGKAHENNISEGGQYIVVNSKFISTEGEVRKYSNDAFCMADYGDILMVLSDVPNGKAIAKCYYVEADNQCTVNQRICRIKPSGIDGKFLLHVLGRNPFFLAFDDGVKQTNLRKEDVLSCPICFPQLPEEQKKICHIVSSLDEMIAAQTQKLEALNTHKKGLMQQLFPSSEEVEA
jgi:type I restriction enzyme S subunit